MKKIDCHQINTHTNEYPTLVTTLLMECPSQYKIFRLRDTTEQTHHKFLLDMFHIYLFSRQYVKYLASVAIAGRIDLGS
jgi:hypothetical protein